MMKLNAEELLKGIGVVNEVEKIIEVGVIYTNAVETSYKIVTEYGEIDFRLIKLKDGIYSKLDYFNPAYEFNRNVNMIARYKNN